MLRYDYVEEDICQIPHANTGLSTSVKTNPCLSDLDVPMYELEVLKTTNTRIRQNPKQK